MALRTVAGAARVHVSLIVLGAIGALLASGCSGGKSGGSTTPTPSGFTISGAVSGASGVTVTLSAAGAADRITTTGTNGSFAFADVASGEYTVQAVKAGYTMAPLGRVVTVAAADVGAVNFAATTSTGASSKISGTITKAWGGALANVTVTLTVGGGSTLGTTLTDGTGHYAFAGVPDGSYGVTPSLAGWVLTPSAPTVVVAGTDVSQSFTANGAYTITGTVTTAWGTPLQGVSVALAATGVTKPAAVSGADGKYTFTGIPGGSFTITPSRSGYAFTPAAPTVAVGSASATQDFTADGAFTLAGTVTTVWGAPVSGVSVALSGGGVTKPAAVTGANGTYSFAVPDGTYTLTPALAGYGFTPPAPSVAMAGASKTRDFTANGAYAISGTVTTAWGTPLQDVSLTIGSGGSSRAVATTDASGGYTIAGLPAGSYTVTPALASYVFTPAAPTVVITSASQARDFSANGAYAISGTVTGVAVSGVSIALSGGGVVKPAAVTGSDGKYAFAGIPNGTYTLTPTLAGYTVSPGSPQVVVSGAPQVQDFTSSAGPSYSISGTLTGAGGAVLPGMTVRLSGSATGIQTTNSSGVYTFAGLAPGGTYTVAPAVFGYTFAPAQQTFASIAANQPASFATAQPAPVTFTGTVSYAGARSGPVYVTINSQNGTGLAARAGPWSGRAFTVRNAPTQYASVMVWMDTLGIGHFNAAADPSVTFGATGTSNPYALGDLTLLDPVGIPTVPSGAGVRIDEVVPFDGGAVVAIAPPHDVNDHEAADSYRVYWNNLPTVDAGHNLGALVVPAGGNLALVKGLQNGVGYWFRVVAYAGATQLPGPGFATPSSTIVGASTGAATVSGTVSYPSLPSPSALYVVAGAGDKGPHYVQRIASPAGTQTGYSLTVPPGTYQLFAIVDLGDDGYLQPGEPSPETHSYAGMVTLAAGSNGGPALTVAPGKSTASVYTMRWSSNGYAGTGLQLDAASNLSPARVLPRSVSVTGPGIPGGVSDLAADAWGGGGGLHVGSFLSTDPTPPVVGDTYAFTVTYTDGSTDAFSPAITGLFGSAPGLVAPAASATNVSTTPTFQWTAPASPPAAYGYQLQVGPQSGQTAWSASLPSSATQVAWNADGRALGSQLAGLTSQSWSVQAYDVFGNVAGADGSFTTGLPQVTTWDALAATTLDGARWQTPQYARTVVGGQAVLSVRADDMQGRLVQGLTYTNQLNVPFANGNPVTTLRTDFTVPAAGAFRDGATANLIGGIRLNYQPSANRNLPFPISNLNFTTFAIEFVDGGNGPKLRARGYHCDTGDCTSLSSTGMTFSTPPAGFTQEGGNVVAPAAYDRTYTIGLSVDANAGVVTWTITGDLSGSGTIETATGTIDASAWVQTAGLQLSTTTNGFTGAQLLARVNDESVAGGGSAGFAPEFDNVWVGVNGATPALYDDFATMGSSDASGLSVSRWASDRALNGSVDASSGVHVRASYVTPSTSGGTANTSLNLLFPATFTTVAADVRIVSDTGQPGLDQVQLGGAFLNDGSGALHNATGDHLANVIVKTTGASYWIGRCTNASCSSQTTVRSGALTGGTVPFGVGTTHTVAVQWDAASQSLGFLVDDATPTVVQVVAPATVPPYNPTKYVQSSVSILAGTAAGTSAAIDATVANVRVVP